MRRRTPLLMLLLFGVVAAGAQAAPRAEVPGVLAAAEKLAGYERTYLDRRQNVIKRFGYEQAGRNLVRDGMLVRGDAVPTPRKRVNESSALMYRWLHPPAPPETPTVASYDPATQVVSSYAPSSGSCPASMAGEASSPTAVNPTSGASGCYQFLPSTWDQYGTSACAEASDCPMSEQTAAMQALCADPNSGGNDAWVAADPC